MHDDYWEDRRSEGYRMDREYRRSPLPPDISDLKIEIYRLKFEIDYLKKNLETARKETLRSENLKEPKEVASAENLEKIEEAISKNQEKLNEKLEEMDKALFRITEKIEHLDNTRFEDALNEKFGSKSIGDVLSKITTLNILGVINLAGLILVLAVCIASMFIKL